MKLPIYSIDGSFTAPPPGELLDDYTEYVRADLYANLETQIADRVKVRQLEWSRDDSAGCYFAETELGEYIAWDNGRVQFGAFETAYVNGGSVGARSKAQADYERRAFSTFDATVDVPVWKEGVVCSRHKIYSFSFIHRE